MFERRFGIYQLGVISMQVVVTELKTFNNIRIVNNI